MVVQHGIMHVIMHRDWAQGRRRPGPAAPSPRNQSRPLLAVALLAPMARQLARQYLVPGHPARDPGTGLRESQQRQRGCICVSAVGAPPGAEVVFGLQHWSRLNLAWWHERVAGLQL